MGDGPLQHPVEADGLDRIVADPPRQRGEAGDEKILQLLLHPANLAAAGFEDLHCQVVVEQAVEDMLDGDMLMLANLGLADGPDQGHFQFVVDHHYISREYRGGPRLLKNAVSIAAGSFAPVNAAAYPNAINGNHLR